MPKRMSFATVLCLIPENVYGRLLKITGNGLAAGCQLFYHKIYGYFLQCRHLKFGPSIILKYINRNIR